MRQFVLLLGLILCWPLIAVAQDQLAIPAPAPAILVADEIEITPERALVARGNVEALQGQTRLRAAAITYDSVSGQLIITGPITIEEGPSIRILASAAELDRDLRNGLLTGARLILNEQLQLASVELRRVNGRYTQLYKTAVTSCQICEGDPRPPLWQIRARRVVHDQEEQQLYFDGAQLRIRDIPVFYFPRLRLPDPTLERATGFLIPSIQSTSQLGTGIRIPYFIKLGDHKDLTLAPFLSSSSKTLELRYRQAFRRGRIEFNGAVTRDDLLPDETRGYLFGNGQFSLPRDYVLSFSIQSVSDIAYLRDYEYSDFDRLKSEIRVERARRDKYVGFALSHSRSLRTDESNDTLPNDVFDVIYERRLFPRSIGGEVRLGLNAHGHFRDSSLPFDGPDLDSIVDGRDVLRLTLNADWRRNWQIGGLESQLRFGVLGDLFRVSEDSMFPDSDAEVAPQGALTLRYPMVRHAQNGASQFLEPVMQVAWTGGDGLDVPNEESTFVEFDEGNLLALSRFPGPDRRERGIVLATGVNWSRQAPEGWNVALSFGQINRETADPNFTSSSGLGGRASDYLIAASIRHPAGLSLSARGLFDDGLDFAKAEVRGGWASERLNLAGAYVFLDEDAVEDRTDAISEFNFEGLYRFSNDWTARAGWRYDFDDGRASRAGLGLAYTNECVRVDFTVDRRFTSSTSVEAQTSLGLTVSLRGFSASPGSQKHQRACRKKAL